MEMVMSLPMRIGIVGCGGVTFGSYGRTLKLLRGERLVELTFACDVVASKRQAVLEEFGIDQFTTDYRELVNAPDVDLVLVLTSMREHGPIAKAALLAGKHVLVEKPMATTLSEAAELVQLANRGPGYLLPAPFTILSPTYQAMHRRLSAGEIGQVTLARARYGHSGPTWGPWFYQEGGGPLFDLGVYNITSLTGFLGPVRRVMAMTGTAQPERIVDGRPLEVEIADTMQIMLEFGDATFATVTTGFTMQRYRSPAIELYGTAGTIQMLGNDFKPNGYELWLNNVGAWQSFDETAPTWWWTDGLRHLIECIQSGATPVVTPQHAYHVLEVMIKAQLAGRDGCAYLIDSTFTLPPLRTTKF
jgi:predicted dehydrogenase